MAIVKKTGPTAKRFPFNVNYNPELRYNWETGRFENDAAAYDPAPGDQCMYGLDRFWDERYLKNAEPFEWYHDYHALKGLLDNFLNKEDNICLIGCGTSEMAADMAADGYKSIMNLDISRICIDEMQTRYADISGPPVSLKKKKLKKGQRLTADDFPKIILGQDLGGVQWRQGNACDLEATFDNQIFDVVLDKALLDALYCAQKPQKQVRAYLQEMDRILKPSGLFFCVSYGLPETRLEKLENIDPEDEEHLAWFCEVHAIPKNEVNPYKVSQLKEPTDVYYVCTCAEIKFHGAFTSTSSTRRLLDGVAVSMHPTHCLISTQVYTFRKDEKMDNEKCMAIASKKARAKAAEVSKGRKKKGGLKKKKKRGGAT